MNTDFKIYGEEYVRGRIYSFVRFQTYLRKIAYIFCEEFQYDKDEIVEVGLSDDGKTVWIHFKDGTIGFGSELLWDKNVRETFKKHYEVA